MPYSRARPSVRQSLQRETLITFQAAGATKSAVAKLKKVRPELSVRTFGDAVRGNLGQAQGKGFHVSFIALNSGAQAAGIQVDVALNTRESSN